jgi:hypothetical protein
MLVAQFKVRLEVGGRGVRLAAGGARQMAAAAIDRADIVDGAAYSVVVGRRPWPIVRGRRARSLRVLGRRRQLAELVGQHCCRIGGVWHVERFGRVDARRRFDRWRRAVDSRWNCIGTIVDERE